jgi:TetR/AcrR family transcriptional regulator, repressor for uid operon
MRTVDPVRHDEKRREILAAAGRCFARDGFRGASTAAICTEAGISPGHLYHYFPSKEAIIEALAAANLDRAAERFAQIAEASDIVAALLSEIEPSKSQRKRTGQPLLLEMLAEAGRNPALATILHGHSRAMRSLLADLIRKVQTAQQIDPGLDADLVASVLISVIDGQKTLAVRDPKLETRKVVDLLKVMIVRFLTPPPARRDE